MLGAPNPMVLLWGWEGVLIYNDGYAKFTGRRHPGLLGMGAREGWPEIADFNDNVICTVLGGTPISLMSQELALDRAGSLESAWLDLDYTPVPDESGAPAGVLVFVSEITDRLIAERRAADEAMRQRQMLQQMPGFAAVLSGPEHRFEYVNDAYVTLAGPRAYLGRPVREVFPDLEGQGFFELLDNVYATGERFVVRATPVTLEDGERFVDLLYGPIRDDARSEAHRRQQADFRNSGPHPPDGRPHDHGGGRRRRWIVADTRRRIAARELVAQPLHQCPRRHGAGRRAANHRDGQQMARRTRRARSRTPTGPIHLDLRDRHRRRHDARRNRALPSIRSSPRSRSARAPASACR